MKAVLIIADGLGGRPTDMDGKTCLEAARTPNLDKLTARSVVGLVDPIGPGIRPGSDTAHLSLLGYDPYSVYTGRGVFECLGIGMEVGSADICCRANFATVEKDDGQFRIVDRRAGRIESGQAELAAALNTEVKLELEPNIDFEFRSSTEHRGAVRFSGRNLSRNISENDPHAIGAIVPDSQALVDEDGAKKAASAVNELTKRSFEVLDNHPINVKRRQQGMPPANIVLLRGAASLPNLESLGDIYGVSGAVVAGGALYRGVGIACGMEPVMVSGATGRVDTDLAAKAEAAVSSLEEYDYVFVHVKETDNAAHDQDAQTKRQFIERIDDELIYPLVEGIDWDNTHLAFTGDHTTPIDFGDHTAEPVPVLFAGPNVRQDSVTAFGEREGARGGLNRFSGMVLPILFNYCNWNPKFGS